MIAQQQLFDYPSGENIGKICNGQSKLIFIRNDHLTVTEPYDHRVTFRSAKKKWISGLGDADILGKN